MQFYDQVWRVKQKIMLAINSIHIHAISYRNINAKGIQNIHLSTEIYGRAGGDIQLGTRVTTNRYCSIVSVGGHLIIGDNTYFSAHCAVVCHDSISIGKDCKFGPNVCIYDHDHLYSVKEVLQDDYKTSPIIIGDNCWIGSNVTILRGTSIGEGSVIGAGTTVKGSIPAHSLVMNERKMNIRELQ